MNWFFLLVLIDEKSSYLKTGGADPASAGRAGGAQNITLQQGRVFKYPSWPISIPTICELVLIVSDSKRGKFVHRAWVITHNLSGKN